MVLIREFATLLQRRAGLVGKRPSYGFGKHAVELGQPALGRTDRDVTFVTLGAVLCRTLEAAEELESKRDVSVEAWDARFVNPLDYGPLLESVRKTGRPLLASDACERGSFLHTLASHISRIAIDALDSFDAPLVVLGDAIGSPHPPGRFAVRDRICLFFRGQGGY